MLTKEFFEKEQKLQEKIRAIQAGKFNKVIEPIPPTIKEERWTKAKNRYWNYHKKPMNSPDNWRKI
jgi:hypothetical protein